MANEIYNMGLPVGVKHQQLTVTNDIKKLAKANKNSAIVDTDSAQQLPAASKALNQQHAWINNVYQQLANNEQHRLLTAEEIMTSPVDTISELDSVNHLWQQFQQLKHRHFPVVNGENKLVGMIADRDILLKICQTKGEHLSTLANKPVKQVMKTPIMSADKNSDIKTLCQLMFRQHIGAVPIINAQQNVIGIVTRSDILRTAIKLGSINFWI